jgi:hypothetical protein
LATPYLAISQIAASQDQKEVTANAAFNALDSSVNGQTTIAMTDADITLTQAQTASGGVLQFTGTLTADRYVNVPAINRAFSVRNSCTGGNLIVQVLGSGGASVSVPLNGLIPLYCDSVGVYALGGSVVSGGGGGGVGGSAQAEYIPTGVIDGSNPTFTVPTVPTGAFNLYKNGVRMTGNGIDFTLTGNSFTYVSGSIPQAGTTPDVHVAVY